MEKGKTYIKSKARMRRKKTIRKHLSGTEQRPRLTVFRSARHIYAQIINDETGLTSVSMSTVAKDFEKMETAKKTEKSFKVGYELGKKAIAAGIKNVCFDRNGFRFHGRVKALAEGVRKAAEEAGISNFV